MTDQCSSEKNLFPCLHFLSSRLQVKISLLHPAGQENNQTSSYLSSFNKSGCSIGTTALLGYLPGKWFSLMLLRSNGDSFVRVYLASILLYQEAFGWCKGSKAFHPVVKWEMFSPSSNKENNKMDVKKAKMRWLPLQLWFVFQALLTVPLIKAIRPH